MGVRLPVRALTVVLGPALVRRRLMALLDDTGVRRLDATSARDPEDRLRLVDELRAGASATGPVALVLVDRFTEGLDATDRRRLLRALRDLAAAGPAVLVDDDDAVAALAVADRTLCADPVRGLVVEPVSTRDLPALVS